MTLNGTRVATKETTTHLGWWVLVTLVCAASGALGARPAAGQDASSSHPLTLRECENMAIEKNERFHVVARSHDSAEALQRESRAATLPTLFLHGAASYAPLDGFDPALTDGGELALVLGVKQTLYDGGIQADRVRQAALGVEQVSADEVRVTEDVLLEVRMAYVDVLAGQRQATLLQSSMDELDSYRSVVRSLASGGAVPKTDVSKVEIQFQNERIAFEAANAARRNAQHRLLEVLGLPLDRSITLADTLTLPGLPASLDEETNLELRQAALGIRAAELDVASARAERWPQLAFEARAGTWTSRARLVEEDSPYAFGYLAGVELDVPLWNWGELSARIGRQQADLEGQVAGYHLLRRHVEAEYRSLRVQLEMLSDRQSRLTENRGLAEEQYRLLFVEYAGGGTTSLEVLEAHRALRDIIQAEEEAWAETQRVHAQLLRIVGGGS